MHCNTWKTCLYDSGLNKCNFFHLLEETLSCKAGVTKRWREGSALSVQGCYSLTLFIIEFRQSLNFSSKYNPVSWLMACIFIFRVRALEHWLWNFYQSLLEEKETILLLRNIALLIIAHIVLYMYVFFLYKCTNTHKIQYISVHIFSIQTDSFRYKLTFVCCFLFACF